MDINKQTNRQHQKIDQIYQMQLHRKSKEAEETKQL